MTLDVKLAPDFQYTGAFTGANVDARKQAVARVKAQKAAQQETMEDAWARVFATKLSDADRAKLQAVKQAMDSGKLGRLPEKAGKRFSKAEAQQLHKALVELNREEILKQMVDEMPANYHMVRNLRELRRMVELTMKEPIVAFDVETTGLDVYADVIIGVSFTLPTADLHFYVPSGHHERTELDTETVLREIKPIVDSEDIGKVLHNAKFDIHMLRRHGYDMKGLAWDTQEAMVMLNENEPSFKLKNLAPKYLNKPADTYDELFGKDAPFAPVPIDVATAYAAKDTHLTWLLYEFQHQHLKKMPSVLKYYTEVEIPLIYTVVEMERTGFEIDVEFAVEFGGVMKKQLDIEGAELSKELGGVSLSSPQQLKPALEKYTGLKLENTDAKKTLKPLALEYPLIGRLLEYKSMKTLYTNFISKMPDLIHPKTGRLHASFKQNGAKTGRFSSGGGKINLQNQPREARKSFIAPKGWLIMGGDFSAQEVRCAAHLTGEPLLIEAFRTNRDPYATLASEYFGKTYEECYKLPDGSDAKERKIIKTCYLASLYGTGPKTLSLQLGCSVEEAKKFLDGFFKKYKHIKRWIDATHQEAQKQGFVYLDRDQRKRRVPAAMKRTRGYDGERSYALRQSVNTKPQGSSAIQTKVTMNELDKLCRRKGWKLWCTVHDEVLLLVPENITNEEVDEFEHVMLNSYRFGEVDNKTDIELGRCWGEMKSRKEWFA